jgi:hypothetical protein
MIQLRVKDGVAYNQKNVIFTNPKCGHEQDFNYSAPYTCQDTTCTERIPDVDRLIGSTNCDNRVKYWAEGKV